MKMPKKSKKKQKNTSFDKLQTSNPSGRVSIFTSGTENPHHVERVTSGTRYAITIPFTCDPEYAIADPQMEV